MLRQEFCASHHLNGSHQGHQLCMPVEAPVSYMQLLPRPCEGECAKVVGQLSPKVVWPLQNKLSRLHYTQLIGTSCQNCDLFFRQAGGGAPHDLSPLVSWARVEGEAHPK